jgi:hypothetical protein
MPGRFGIWKRFCHPRRKGSPRPRRSAPSCGNPRKQKFEPPALAKKRVKLGLTTGLKAGRIDDHTNRTIGLKLPDNAETLFTPALGWNPAALNTGSFEAGNRKFLNRWCLTWNPPQVEPVSAQIIPDF